MDGGKDQFSVLMEQQLMRISADDTSEIHRLCPDRRQGLNIGEHFAEETWWPWACEDQIS